MALQASGIADLVTTTLRNLGPPDWTDIMTDYQSTIALKRLLVEGKVNFKDGYEIQFNLKTGIGGSARTVGIGAVDVIDSVSDHITGNIPWRHMTWNYAFDYREPLMNRGRSQILDMIKSRRIGEFASAVVLCERLMWRVPSTTNDTDFYGIPYWVVKSNTSATFANNDGFNGTVPSGYTTVAGINPTTYPRWRNYATQYTTVSKDDFVRKARRMAKKTDFKPIVDEIPTYNRGDQLAFYTNYGLYQTLVEILESQNENLGMDLAPYENKVRFMGADVEYVPELENDTTNPFYQINWGLFGAAGLNGAWMKETTVPQVAGQHTMTAVHTDCSFNTLCYDRRRQGVLAIDTTLPA